MDAKITKLRLSRMLSYDWIKIVITAAAAILVWVLIFTMTATRITSAQQFQVCNYLGNYSFSTEFNRSYSNAQSDGVFSREVIEWDLLDLAANADMAGELLSARVAIESCDVMFVSEEPNVNSQKTTTIVDGEEKTEYQYTYLETFLNGYRWNLFLLDREDEKGFFKKMEKYLNTYYAGDYTNEGDFDTAKVEKDFRARIKRTEDKRYKNENQIQKGLEEEIDRIQKYRAALIEFDGYLNAGIVKLTKTTVMDEKNPEQVVYEGTYSINLCPDVAVMGKLSDVAAYPTISVNEKGEEITTKSALNMNLCIFNFNGKEEAFHYEPLLYVNHVIRGALNAN